MKLARDPWPIPKTGLLSNSTVGRWQSADGNWGFHRVASGEWVITIGFAAGVAGVSVSPFNELGIARAKILSQFGLANVPFKTRREAVAALALVLSGIGAGKVSG